VLAKILPKLVLKKIKFCFCFLPELQALAELLGAFGMKHLGQKMMHQIASQVGEIRVRGDYFA